MTAHRFQINLRGIIDLLSNHLYSGPAVYLRELLQNGVDAIRARQALEPGHAGRIELEVIASDDGPPTLVFVDDGVGLTEAEVHGFLATIGESSKRDDLLARRGDYLGQFGIGLLSCFLVSDEIVVVTRSAQPGEHATVEWRGRPDGTYAVKRLEHDSPPGTQVYLRSKPGQAEWLGRERVLELGRRFGGMLPIPIDLVQGEVRTRVNDTPPPWRDPAPDPEALLEYGQALLGETFWEAIPLRAPGLAGAAFVLPYRPSLASQGTHRVYLKSMLLAESAKNLVPEWAFFVKCVVDADRLRPTASREALYEDEALEVARAGLGRALRDWLVELVQGERARWRAFLRLHYLSIKALALQDDELYALFIDWLPFETSLGELTLAQVREMFGQVRYVGTVDQFRQIAQVAAAQSMCVVNAGYTYEVELLERYAQHGGGERDVKRVEPSELTQAFADLTPSEAEDYAAFLTVADEVLDAHRCRADVKRFEPASLPTLYTTDPDAHFRRSVEETAGLSDDLWSGLLGNLSSEGGTLAQLCFNVDNPLVQRIAREPRADRQRRCVQMLYVQALLLGHHPLGEAELTLLNEGLLGLIEWGLEPDA